jgi:hypothetical protein
MIAESHLSVIELSEKRKRLILPFVECTKNVFSTMLNWETELIGIFSTDQDVAFAAAEAFFGNQASHHRRGNRQWWLVN